MEKYFDAIETFFGNKYRLGFIALIDLCSFLWEISHGHYGFFTWFMLFGAIFVSALAYCQHKDDKPQRQQTTKSDYK